MVNFDEFSAWVEVDGVRSEEFNTYICKNEQKVSTVTCWIPSEKGKSFKIYWTDAILQSATDGRVYVDGHFSGGQNLRPGRASNLACKRGVRTSTETTRPFVFSSVNLTDDDAHLDDPSAAGIGNIEIIITRVQFLGHIPWSENVRKPIYEGQKIHERKKKCAVHQVGFSEERRKRMTSCTETKEMGPPVVAFLFKYRPLDFLRAYGIAPPLPIVKDEEPAEPASTLASSIDQDDTSMSHTDEAGNSDSEEARLEARLALIRTERKRKAKVKQEAMILKPACLPGEVIDLT